jgi:hypothetical protein
MSFPTVLSPWYIVQQQVEGERGLEGGTVYYRNDPEGAGTWTSHASMAMLFMSLQAASRIAHALGAEVRVLTTKEDLAPFRPEEN